jgi:hypothetical protein
MLEILGYIESNEWLVPVVLFCSLTLCWVLEAVAPLAAFDYKKLRHIGVNTVFLVTSLLASLPLVFPAQAKTLNVISKPLPF